MIKLITCALSLSLGAPLAVTPRPGLWNVSARVTAQGKPLGKNVPPLTGETRQCITSEIWAKRFDQTPIPGCTISGAKRSATELSFDMSCPDRGLHARYATSVVTPTAVETRVTERMSGDEGAVSSTVVTSYTFLSASCGSVQPETAPVLPQ